MCHRGLKLPVPDADAVQVEQSQSCIDSVVETADFAVTLMGAIGSAVASIGERRGLGTQQGISPASTIVGSPNVTITVTGVGFVSGAVVNYNGSPLATSFVDQA